jgi:hypothetical protein
VRALGRCDPAPEGGTNRAEPFLCFEIAPSPGGRILDVVLNGRMLRGAMLAAVVVLTVDAAFVSTAESAPLRAAVSSTGGVFVVTYEPQPMTSRDSLMRVKFATTGRAQPGWEYYVRLVIRQPKAKNLKCANRAASWVPSMVRRVQHISGVAGGNYTVWLRAAKSLGGHFCAGQAVLEIGTGPNGREGQRRRPLRQLPLRIAPVR